jgi:hypothetical protein
MFPYFPQFAPCTGVGQICAGCVPGAGGGPNLGSRWPLNMCSGHVLVTSQSGILQKSLSQFAGSWQGYLNLSFPVNANMIGKDKRIIKAINNFLSDILRS